MIGYLPYYLPTEFSLVIVTAVYIAPLTNTNKALNQLNGVIDRTDTSRQEDAFIVAGDFTNAKLRTVLPRYHQHISCPTRDQSSLNHGQSEVQLPGFQYQKHVDQRDTHMRMLFFDYSLAFNTIVSSKPVTKFRDFGLNTALCD